MDTTSIEQRLTAAKDAARKAGALLLGGPQDGMQAKAKGKSDFVTVMDLASERLIRTCAAQFPRTTSLREPASKPMRRRYMGDRSHRWDNNIHGLPTYTSASHMRSNALSGVGVVFVPCLDKLSCLRSMGSLSRIGVSICVFFLSRCIRRALDHQSLPAFLRNSHSIWRSTDALHERREIRDFGSAPIT